MIQIRCPATKTLSPPPTLCWSPYPNVSENTILLKPLYKCGQSTPLKFGAVNSVSIGLSFWGRRHKEEGSRHESSMSPRRAFGFF